MYESSPIFLFKRNFKPAYADSHYLYLLPTGVNTPYDLACVHYKIWCPKVLSSTVIEVF